MDAFLVFGFSRSRLFGLMLVSFRRWSYLASWGLSTISSPYSLSVISEPRTRRAGSLLFFSRFVLLFSSPLLLLVYLTYAFSSE